MFTDYYEILEISPNANAETIERIFRHLAMRYHPDNQETGDLSRFTALVEAHNTLKDPVKRGFYLSSLAHCMACHARASESVPPDFKGNYGRGGRDQWRSATNRRMTRARRGPASAPAARTSSWVSGLPL